MNDPTKIPETHAKLAMRESDPLYRHRMKLCEACPHAKTGFLAGFLFGQKGTRCDLCGCFVHVKGRFPFFHCPKGDW